MTSRRDLSSGRILSPKIQGDGMFTYSLRFKLPFLLLALSLAGAAGAADTKDDSGGRSTDPMYPNATMEKAYTAEKLYTCPMHHEIVSADSEATCPLCKMKLVEMEPEKVVELRSHELFGCPMDPIVASGEDVAKGCPVCGMNLMPIAHDGKMMHGAEGSAPKMSMESAQHHHEKDIDSSRSTKDDSKGHEGQER